MEAKRFSIGILACLAAAACGSLFADRVAHADPQSPRTSSDLQDTPNQVSEVIVTAQRREQRISDVGMTVNTVDASLLSERNISASEDLSQVFSALTITKNADGTPVYTLRGVGYNSISLGGQPSVSVYEDEAPLPYAPMTQGPIYDLERVEVLKGPQGTLYGQNSTGGAINYIAAKPTDQFSTGMTATYGRFSTFEGQGFISGPLTETLSARLSLDGTDGGAWQSSYLRDATIGAQRRYAGRIQLVWKPTDKIRGYLSVNGWVDTSDNQIPQFIAVVPRVPANVNPALYSIPTAPPDDRAADWTPDQSFARNNHQWQATGRLDFDVTSTVTLTSLTNFVRVSIDSRYDNDAVALNLADVTTGGSVSTFSQEFRLADQFLDGRMHVFGGVNYQRDHDSEYTLDIFDGVSSTVNISSPPLPPPGLGTLDQSVTRGAQANVTTGVFANIEWNFADPLTAVAGVRYTDARHYNRTCTADTGIGNPDNGWAHIADGLIGLLSGTPGTLKPGDCVTLDSNLQAGLKSESFGETNVAWRGGLNYKPTSDSLIYGLVSRGFKAGNYPVFSAISASSLRPVVQEQLTSFELGAKSELAKKITTNVAVYYYDYKNKQLLTETPDPVFGLVETLGNVPKSHSYGLDLDVVARPFGGLTARVAAAYQKTRIGPFIDYNIITGDPVKLDGNSFNYAPDWTVNSDVQYEFPVMRHLTGFVGGNMTYNSETYADLAQTPLLHIAPFATFGLRVGIASTDGKWQAMLWGNNLTDRYYWTNSVYGYDSLYRLAGNPRTFGVTVSYKQ